MRCGAGKIFVVGVAYVEILIELPYFLLSNEHLFSQSR